MNEFGLMEVVTDDVALVEKSESHEKTSAPVNGPEGKCET